MSEKILKSIKDENPELQKQIGCINGFFQLFNRQHFLAGRRSIRSSQSQKRLTPPGKSNDLTKELNRNLQKSSEKNLKDVKEKQGFFTESSITSFSSSSCSSSLSSLDYNKLIHVEQLSFRGRDFPETTNGKLGAKQLNASNLSQRSFDLRNVVRDSLHGGDRGLLVTTANKEETVGQALKYIDSPRPLEQPKSENTGRTSFNESFHVLAKLQEAPWNSNKEKDRYLLLASKDRPRLSYDGRYSRDTFKSTTKLKELPRLSLDSRERSMKGLNHESKSGNFLKDTQQGIGNSNVMLKQLQEPETSRRSSSIVAKLMGLEALPDLTPTCGNPLDFSNAYLTDKIDPLARSLRTTDVNKHQSSGSPRNPKKECTSSQLRSANSVMKEKPSSRFPIEPAPWKQQDSSRVSQMSASNGREAPTKTSSSSLSVYGEIEKRLAKLEFKKSGKDLRALKQILETMQKSRDSLDITRDQTSNSAPHVINISSLNESSDLASPRNLHSKDPITSTVKRSNSSHKSPIVIMTPAKLTRKTSNSACLAISTDSKSALCTPHAGYNGRSVDKQTAKCFTPTIEPLGHPFSQPLCSSGTYANRRTSKSMQSSKVPPQNIFEENTTTSGKTGADSPRLQHKNFGLDKLYRPTNSISDSSRSRRRYGGQLIESSSSSRTPRQTSPNLQESNGRMSKTSSDMTLTDLSYPTNTVSLQFERKRSLASHSDIEVININQSDRISNLSKQYSQKQNNAAKGLREKRSMEEIVVATPEQPSPVSVLDATFYRDDPPSPVKMKPHTITDNKTPDSDEIEKNSVDLSLLSNTMKPSGSSDIDGRLNNSQHMSQTLQQIKCTYEEPIPNFTPTFDRKNPDHRYISQMLSALGLLSETDSGHEVNLLSHLINSNSFIVLEQIMGYEGHLNNGDSMKISQMVNVEQMQRKLIFDVVNNILVKKRVSESLSRQWFSPNKLTGRLLRGQKLLSELCSEIDQLQCNCKNGSQDDEDDNMRRLLLGDFLHHSVNWTDCHGEIPEVVLDIERLIFKDLITEIVLKQQASLVDIAGS
ncbi:Protein LONGIFOLIA [Quillaja saponaria]|uniref:Protein LONGIFOLIA n=1 Tax=Quillaja saponaria TaxID=32244 RepID=A0AAD7VCT3_QUISA|nr:Protein LONGIFOLIA [Quillaja saponaria]